MQEEQVGFIQPEEKELKHDTTTEEIEKQLVLYNPGTVFKVGEVYYTVTYIDKEKMRMVCQPTILFQIKKEIEDARKQRETGKDAGNDEGTKVPSGVQQEGGAN